MRFAALFVCFLGAAASALPLSDNQFAFTVDVPSDFVRLEEGEVPGALHAFRREPAAEGVWAVLSFRAIPRLLSQTEKLDPDHRVSEASARKGATQAGSKVSNFEYRQVSWKGFPLEVMVMHTEDPSGAVVSFHTMVPLASGALTVQLAGTQSDEPRLLGEFNAVVASIEAETNWGKGLTLNDVERVGVVLGLAIGVLVMWRLMRKRPAKG